MITELVQTFVSLKTHYPPEQKIRTGICATHSQPGRAVGIPQAGKPVNYLAKRFAAKEAFAKAVGYGHTRRGVFPQYRCRA